MPMQSSGMVSSGGGGGGLYGSLLSQLQGRQARGLPGNMQYLMQLLSMMPQGQPSGQGNYGPTSQPKPTAYDEYMSDPINKASYLAGRMGMARGGTGDQSYLQEDDYFTLLQKMLLGRGR